jgi:hypothetical protein
MSILEFKEVLDSLRKEYECDQYNVGRITHCNLLYSYNGKEHIFEVRGWKLDNDTLSISAVNWTMTAGSCVIELTEKNVNDWRVKE